ncbi:MAG TPA: plastocyanin/azurin family copper-binding protein [Gemmatimonadaceae bacterium]|nr:plastocyanin/azurin family copper-binding protein [Gemmatimonadaceae bacterium]
MSEALRSIVVLVAIACAAPVAAAQAAPHGHLITVHLVDRPNGQFAFDPGTINAQRGDTVRFVQQSSAPHNVSFRTHPKDAKLGGAAVGPYILSSGQTYDLVIDTRFPDGTYTFACDPHESVGMKGTLVVGPHP